MARVPVSSTARAALIGLRMCRAPEMAPAARSDPSMIEASSSCTPSVFSAAPWPALKCGESSSTTTAASTASRARPPLRSTVQPARRACASTSSASAHSTSSKSDRAPTPQPPWIASAQFIIISVDCVQHAGFRTTACAAFGARPQAAIVRSPSRTGLACGRLDSIPSISASASCRPLLRTCSNGVQVCTKSSGAKTAR